MVCEIILLFFFDVGAKNQRKRKKSPLFAPFLGWNTQFFVVCARTLKGVFCKKDRKERCFCVLLGPLFVSFPSGARGEAIGAKKTTRRFVQNNTSFLVKPHVVFLNSILSSFSVDKICARKEEKYFVVSGFLLTFAFIKCKCWEGNGWNKVDARCLALEAKK